MILQQQIIFNVDSKAISEFILKYKHSHTVNQTPACPYIVF